MKRIIYATIAAIGMFFLSACTPAQPEMVRYRSSFMGTFDTMVEIIAYAPNEEAFSGYADFLQEEMVRYHRLFDLYNNYPEMNNLKTINDQAGIAPVVVDKEIIDLLLLGREWEQTTGGAVNLAFGPTLAVWHEYRERYQGNPEDAQLPPMTLLEQKALLGGYDQIIIDEQASTVFLPQAGMRLDVGAAAKGYATELVGKSLYEKGCTSFILSSGGNVRIFDAPADSTRTAWGVGIQDPQKDPADPQQTYLDTVFANDCAIVTSGNYQRFYKVGDQKVHHIIDPQTLMPANRYSAVTIVAKTSTEADMLSTALFILEEEAGRALLEQYDAQAYWVYPNGDTRCTDGLIPLLKERGGATSVAKK